MHAELAAIMDHAGYADLQSALSQNITGKATKFNEAKTASFLKKLYGLNSDEPAFKCFQYFWDNVEQSDRPVLILLYAVGRDILLRESLKVISGVPEGLKATVESFSTNIANLHPGKYSASTLRSAAQNIASSWKQAGFLEGKVKNIRRQPVISAQVVAFALLSGYLSGARGEGMFRTHWTKTLMVTNAELHRLAHGAAMVGLLHYQHAGAITIIQFNNIFRKIGIHGYDEQN